MRCARIINLTFAAAVLFFPVLADAHGSNFFEFNPDSFLSFPLNPANYNSVSEIFIPQNEFLGAFDLWVDNNGPSGNISFELRNESNVLITSQTVTIPTIAPTAGGKRFHVDFPAQVSVLSNKKYLLNIITTMPSLRVYYSDRIDVLSHNAPYASGYLNGAAKIDSEEKKFSFKFALYESFETSPPILSNIVSTAVSSVETRLDFNANEAVDYKIDYGFSGGGYTQSINFTGAYKFCGAGISVCSLTIPTSLGRSYSYLLTARDVWSNETLVTGSFISGQAGPISTVLLSPTPSVQPTPSPSPSDSSPLIISNFRVSSVTDKSVEVAWHTNKAANANLLISFSTNRIDITAVNDSTFELEHLLKTANALNPNTTYLARVISVDSFNNTASATLAFTTLKNSPVNTPTPLPAPTAVPSVTSQPPNSSQPPSLPVSSPGNSSTHSLYVGSGNNFSAIQWNAPSGGEPKDGYRIDIFDKNRNLVKQITLAKGASSAGISLPEGEYYSVVYGNNGKVLEKVAKPTNFTVSNDTLLKRLLALWPYIVMVLAFLAGFIFWELHKRKAVAKIVP